MQTKLTLRLEADLVRRAKAYARRTGKSVSRLVADYFAHLARRGGEPEAPLPPPVRSLLGALSEVDEQDYRRHLESKHR